MKKLILSLLIIFPLLAPAQEPMWTSSTFRDLNYPASVWYTGFARNYVQAGSDVNSALRALERDAQNRLAESIIVAITSESRLENFSRQQQIGGQFSEILTTDYQQVVHTATSATAVGMNVRSFHNTATGAIYAFALVNRFELIGFYRSNLTINLRQAESHLQSARNLEQNRETTNARQQIELAKPLLDNIRQAQHLLIAIDANASVEDLQLQKTADLHSALVQMQARLAQAVFVYIESSETLFGTQVNIVTERLMAELARNGCSFVENSTEADFRLRLQISVRDTTADNSFGFMFATADASVELFDMHRQRIVYSDNISERSGFGTLDGAGRRALNNLVPVIAERLSEWLN